MIDEELSANVKQAWMDIFNRYVGKAGGVSYKGLHEMTGIPEGTLYKIGSGDHKPTSDALIAIFRALPPGAMNMLLGINGYGVHWVEGDGCVHEAATATAEWQHHYQNSVIDDGHYDRLEHAQGHSIRERVIDAMQRLHLRPPKRKFMPYQQHQFMREAGD